MMPSFSSFFCGAGSRRRAGFSLIEVTLALGIVTFALVGAVGVLPTALSEQPSRAPTKTARPRSRTTLFAGFRSQPFQSVCYLDAQFDSQRQPAGRVRVPHALDLNTEQPGHTG